LIETDALLSDKAMLTRIEARDPLQGGRMEDRIRGIELLRQRVAGELFVEGWVEGPCAEAADLRGINRLMTDFTDDPSSCMRSSRSQWTGPPGLPRCR